MVARIRTASRWRLAFGVVFAALGAWFGYLIGSGWGSTGLSAFVNAAVSVVLTVLILAFLLVTAVLIGWKREDSAAAMRPLLVVAALFVGGIAVGWVASVVYEPPPTVVLEGRGTMRLSTSSLDGYVGDVGLATCRSQANSERLELVETVVVGRIGLDFVEASVRMFPGDLGRELEIRVSLRPAVKGPVEAPGWMGTGAYVDGAVGDTRGRISFSELLLGAGQDGVQPSGWPTSLTGTIEWSCVPTTPAV